jgi:ABC-2 type transport system ATP-binding protein
MLVAEGLGARTRRGWVFRDVDLTVEDGAFETLTGPTGSGRTSLLLALAGYFKVTEGAVRRDGPAALAYVAGVHEPEPGLSVAEHVEERLVLLGRRRRLAKEHLPAIPLPPKKLGRDLDLLEAHLLCLHLALLNEPAIVFADDVDKGLSEVEQQTLAEALRDSGKTIVVTSR